MSEWQEFLIEDLAEFCNAKRIPLSSMQRQELQGSYPYYGASGIVDYVSNYIFDGSHILISEDGENLKSRNTPIAFEASGKFWVNNHAHILKAKEPHLTKLIIHYFAQLDLSPYLTGAVQPKLNKATLSKIPLYLPKSALEQKAIASVLSSLDDKIDLLHRQNKTLEAMAETLFRQWFIEEAKEDWEKVTLGDIVNITSSKRIFYSEYVDEGIPFYRSKEIIELNKSGQTRSELFISNERFDGIVAKFGAPVEGDILLTSVGTLGVTYQVKASDRFYFKDGNLTWFKDFKHISSNIIFCWLNSKNGKEQLDNISIGSTQAALTIQGLKSLELSLPSLNVIQKLDEQLVVIYQKVNANQSQIQTLEKLRDTLLPKLMSGEVRVQYQTAEVA